MKGVINETETERLMNELNKEDKRHKEEKQRIYTALRGLVTKLVFNDIIKIEHGYVYRGEQMVITGFAEPRWKGDCFKVCGYVLNKDGTPGDRKAEEPLLP